MRLGLLCCLSVALTVPRANAGLYYSGETYAELPAQWRGFLLDHRMLRSLAGPQADAGPLKFKFEQEAGRLEAKAGKQKLTGDEAADLGALLIRLGKIDAALDRLRAAQREHPNHFAVAA